MSGRRQPVLVRRSGRRRRWIHRSAFRRRYRPLRRRCRPARRGQRRSVRSADGRCDRRLRDVARHGAPRQGRRPRWRRRAVLARASRAHGAGTGRRTIRRRSGDWHRPVRRTLHGAAAARSHSRRRALRASAVRRARLAQSPAARGRPVHVRDAGLRARRHDCRNGAVNFIDDRGRIFGGVNAVDAAAAAGFVAIVALPAGASPTGPGPAPAPGAAPAATPLRVDAAQVSVRFVCRPAVAALIKVGDADGGSAASGAPKSAVISSIGARHDGTSRSTVSDAGRWLTVDEPVVTLDVVLAIPVTNLDGAWMYKDAAVKAGATLGFETSSYALRGWILNVTVSRPRSGE